MQGKGTEWVTPCIIDETSQTKAAQPGKKRRAFTRRDTQQKQEMSRSISRAREEHKRNLDEINQINDSVKYSPTRHSMPNNQTS